MDRLDYVSMMCNEHAYVMAIEKLLGVKVPERAQWLRVMQLELSRITAHLFYFGGAAATMGMYSNMFWGVAEPITHYLKPPMAEPETTAALRESMWEIPLPVIVLGGVYSGFFAVSEAAAVTVVYVLVVEVLIYREIPIRRLPSIMRESMMMVGGIICCSRRCSSSSRPRSRASRR